MSRTLVAAGLVVLLSAPSSFHAQAPDVGPYTFGTMAYGVRSGGLMNPVGVAVDGTGQILVSQWDRQSSGFGNGPIVRVSTGGVVSALASVSSPRGISVDTAGNAYIASWFSSAITKVTPAGVTSVFASGGGITFPTDVAVAPDGTAYVTSLTSVHRVSSAGTVTIFAEAVGFTGPAGIAVGPDGSVYVTDNNTLRKITIAGVATTIAGTAGVSGAVDGTGAAARFSSPGGLTVTADGTVYLADRGNHTIRKVTQAGVVTTLAGTAGSSGSVNGTGSVALFNDPSDVAVDPTGTLLHVADAGNNQIRTVTLAGVVTTLAGGPVRNYAGANWRLNAARGITLSTNGLLYVADTANHVIRRFALDVGNGGSRAGATVAGLAGTAGSTDDTGIRFAWLHDVVIDGSGTMYVTDASHDAIYTVSSSGDVTTYAGTPGTPGWRDGPRASALFDGPAGLGLDAAGNLYVAERENRTIRKITPAGEVSTLAGMAGFFVETATDGTGFAATFRNPKGLAVNATGVVYIVDNNAIRAITPAGVVTTLAGSSVQSGSADGTGAAARFNYPADVTVDAAGNVLVVDSFNSTIRKVTPAGVVTTLAGLAGNRDHVDGTGSAARFSYPSGIGLTSTGDFLVTDNGGNLIRRVTPGGVVTTVAGSTSVDAVVDGQGTAAGFGSASAVWGHADGTARVTDGAALRAISADATVTTIAGGANPDGSASRFNAPASITSDASGALYVADTGNHTIRRLTTAGVVTTLAGLAGTSGATDGTGAAARFVSPAGIAAGVSAVYVADTGNHAIRAVSSAGVVTTIAGVAGTPGSTDATGTAALFNAPRGIAVDAGGTLFVADTGNHVVRRISSGGVVTTLAGEAGTAGATDGTGTGARFSSPAGVAVDAAGNVYVSDAGNNTIRAISPAGAVTTIGGTAGSPGLVNAVSVAARFEAPAGLVVDAAGTLYITDAESWAIRQGVLGAVTAPVITTQPVSQTVNQGQVATFAVVATSNPAAAYQWQYEEAGSGQEISDSIHASYQTSTSLRSGRVRCVVTNAAGSTFSEWATLTVNGLAVSPARINVGATRPALGQPVVDVTPPQTVTVTFAGTGTPAWTATSRVPWLQITGGSGTGSGSFTVVLSDPQNYLGNYENSGGTSPTSGVNQLVDVTATNLGLSSTVPVILSLAEQARSPVGNMDTPGAFAPGLAGTFGVTGWALDDVAVQRVEVWRNCVEAVDRPLGACAAAVPGGAADFVFIGNATFVTGARPDVQNHAEYGRYPLAHRAGWGYLLLSNALPHVPNVTPHGGQGAFTLLAYAVDAGGNRQLLGTHYITLANDTATLPFGAIDTPDQGATIPSASAPYNDPAAYPVFGWAVTQSGKCIDTTAVASYRVFVDGVARTLTPGSTWFAGQNRSDVAAAYPGLCNTTNAVAAYYLDTRTLANGVHTIGWEVTDDANQTAGIGSRFFTVLNAGADQPFAARDASPAVLAPVSSLDSLVPDTTRALRAAVGRVETSVAVRAETDVVYRLQLPQLGRLALDLGGPVTMGYQRLGQTLLALPGGSALDAAAGRFFWQPPVGFLGAFDLVFVTGTGRVEVQITIVDPSSTSDAVSVVIESPKTGANPNPVITVAGTARDGRAITGTGIEAVHVWARRVDGIRDPGSLSDVTFLGAAALTGDNYRLVSTPLAPGTYQIEVYAWVARQGTWAPAATVIIAVR